MDKKKKVADNTFFSSLWKKMTNKKKHPVSTSSSLTSLVMPDVSSVVPIGSTSSNIRFFERDPPLIQEKNYDHRDLKLDEKINNTLELAYFLQKPDLSPEEIKHVETLRL